MADIQPTHLQFGQHHIPTLESGDYSLNLVQSLSDGVNTIDFSENLQFSIQGERFHLAPLELHSVFPPANSLGEYSGVLPHVVLNRTTLPWERNAVPFVDGESDADRQEKKSTPWLALLIFYDGELSVIDTGENLPEDQAKLQAEKGYVLKLGDLESNFANLSDGFKAASSSWSGISRETGQSADDTTSVIFVEKDILEPILPSRTELKQLCHTRQGTDSAGNLVGDEMSVIIGNRLAKSGGTVVVHLVSIEHRYSGEEFDFGQASSSGTHLIPLISLKSWTYSCISHQHSFRGLLLHLNQQLLFRAPLPNGHQLDGARTTLSPPLRQVFAANDHPVRLRAPVVDKARKEIILKDYHFLIGDSGKIYNQAGRELFEIDDVSDDQVIANGIIGAGYNIPVATATRPVDHPYWWVVDREKRFFLRVIGDQFEVLKVELDHSPTLRIPETGHAETDAFLSQGYVGIPHHMRRGHKTVSWYRGPLISSKKRTSNLSVEIHSVETADELMRYHTANGMFEVSYAAAWELGRLLALRSKNFSLGLHRWRRKHARAAQQLEQAEEHLHLPYFGEHDIDQQSQFPPELYNWLEKLWTFEGIPYNYLIPDERMLPKESLRFFSVDPDWMACLVHGAFSVGKDAGSNHWQEDDDSHPVNVHLNEQDALSGFILKSEVVSGWPGLQVEITVEHEGTISKVNAFKRLLGPSTLLFLFVGEAQRIDFHLKPEALHFGFYLEEEDAGWQKSPRDDSGAETETVIDLSDPASLISLRPQDPNYTGVIDINQLFLQVKAKWQNELNISGDFDSSQFALAMIEGVDEVSFLRST